MQLYSRQANERPYWNDYLETMPREQLDKLHLRRLQELIKYAYDNVPMYRVLYDEAGLKPEDVKTLDDYHYKVPSIDKSVVLRFQGKNPPYGDALVKGSDELINMFFMTSGSTGKPFMEPGNYRDGAMENSWVPQWWAHGIRARDSFYIAFPFGTFMAFWAAYYDAQFMGAHVITAGGLDTASRVRQIIDLKPTVLVATPTYALRLAEVGREMGIDMTKTSIKWITTAGEAGSVIPYIKSALERAWGAKAMDLYGISELWGATSWQCPVHDNRMHATESISYGIVVDDDGKLVPDGGVGEFVLTSYTASLQPLIKYRTSDRVRWSHQPCECGRTWMWLDGGVLGRSDQMIIIKGTNIYPTGVQAIIGEIEGLSQHIEIHVSKGKDGDAVNVKVEPKENISDEEVQKLTQKTDEELRRQIGVRIGVEIVKIGSLPRYEQKAKMVFDHRREV